MRRSGAGPRSRNTFALSLSYNTLSARNILPANESAAAARHRCCLLASISSSSLCLLYYPRCLYILLVICKCGELFNFINCFMYIHTHTHTYTGTQFSFLRKLSTTFVINFMLAYVATLRCRILCESTCVYYGCMFKGVHNEYTSLYVRLSRRVGYP